MKLTREHGVWMCVGAALLAFGAWIARNTEWVDIDVPDPVKGPALRDQHYRLKAYLTRLGATVQAPENLDQLPPPKATLLLNSSHWDLFPERAAALRRWVEAGGDLVLPGWSGRDDELDWVPIKTRAPPRISSAASSARDGRQENDEAESRDDDDDDADEPAALPPTVAPPAPSASDPPALKIEPLASRKGADRCVGVVEPASVAPAFGVNRSFDSCLYAGVVLDPTGPMLWALDSARGHVVLRVPLGRGTVTVSSSNLPWHNQAVLEKDNALLAVAMLRARAGREIWIVNDESRPPLLSFLWSTGAPAVLLGLAALVFALWRGALRFGPPLAVAPPARRSMAEQIRGTASFISLHGGQALHAAQLRALGDAARGRIRGYDTMIVAERAQAIAGLTGIDAEPLARAMNTGEASAFTRQPGAALALLETALRRLTNTQASSTSPR